MQETTKVNIKTFLIDFRHWVDKEMKNWDPWDRYECVEDSSQIIDDDSELCRFLAEYPQYNMDLLYANLDDLDEIVKSVAGKYKEDGMY